MLMLFKTIFLASSYLWNQILVGLTWKGSNFEFLGATGDASIKLREILEMKIYCEKKLIWK